MSAPVPHCLPFPCARLGEKRDGPRRSADGGGTAEPIAAKPPANRPAGAGSGPRAQRAKAAAAGGHGRSRPETSVQRAQYASPDHAPPRGTPPARSAVLLRVQDAERLASLARVGEESEELLSASLGFRELLSPASQHLLREAIVAAGPPVDAAGTPRRPRAEHVWRAVRRRFMGAVRCKLPCGRGSVDHSACPRVPRRMRWALCPTSSCAPTPTARSAHPLARADHPQPPPGRRSAALACDLLDKCGGMLAERTGLGALFDVLRAGIFPAIYVDYKCAARPVHAAGYG